MSVSPVGVGVIGTGSIGRLHAHNLATRVVGGRLIAVHDADDHRAARLAGELGTDVCPSAEALIAHPNVDAVIVATPTPTHAALTVAAIEAGKHVFCEKPLAQSAAQADEVITAAERAGGHVQVGFQRRFDPDYTRVIELLDAGELGRPRLYLSSLREPAPLDGDSAHDFILHFVIHDLDAARWLIGEIDEITTIGQTLDDTRTPERNIENLVTTLRFANGALGVLDTGANAAYGFECRAEVLGDAATARIGREAVGNIEQLQNGLAARRVSLDSEQRFACAHINQLEAFCGAIRQGTTASPSVYDGHASLVLVDAAEKSLHEGHPVRLGRTGDPAHVRYALPGG